MSEQLDSPVASVDSAKTAAIVITLVVGMLGLLCMICGCTWTAIVNFIPYQAAPVQSTEADMRIGGWIISGLVITPGLVLMIIAMCVWFFIWRKIGNSKR
jgi:hypothetical protein